MSTHPPASPVDPQAQARLELLTLTDNRLSDATRALVQLNEPFSQLRHAWTFLRKLQKDNDLLSSSFVEIREPYERTWESVAEILGTDPPGPVWFATSGTWAYVQSPRMDLAVQWADLEGVTHGHEE